jgi:pyruvoyl-dependent arginine decarboxylase (PvlArgDC)
MGEVHGSRGDHITAGVGQSMVSDKETDQARGGFVTEYEGHASPEKAEEQLRDALNGQLASCLVMIERLKAHACQITHQLFLCVLRVIQ